MKTILVIFLLINTLCKSQIPKNTFFEDTEEKYDSRNFSETKLSFKEFEGVYHFGESEGEWDLVLLANKDSIIVQLWEGYWSESPTNWITKVTTYNNTIIKGSKFTFGKYSGMIANHKGKTTKALLLFCDPTIGKKYSKDSAEIGMYQTTLETYFDYRKYSIVSRKIIDSTYLKGKTKLELKIMRNEIYAQYGLIFKTEELKKYFLKQDWYKPSRTSVENCLTTIEKGNIEIIKMYE